MDKISIGNINIDKGTFINYGNANGKGATKFTDISIRIRDLLIDSVFEMEAAKAGS